MFGELGDSADDLRASLERAWRDLAAPADGWTGPERVAIAGAARVHREGGDPGRSVLAGEALDAVALLTTKPAQADEPWVGGAVDALGEQRYVGLVGVVAIVSGIDTVVRLLGAELEPLPEPDSGDPEPRARDSRLKRRSAWVSMTGPPLPRHALSAAPHVQATANGLLDRLYMPASELRSENPVRGLTRAQIELVILAVSLANECFY